MSRAATLHHLVIRLPRAHIQEDGIHPRENKPAIKFFSHLTSGLILTLPVSEVRADKQQQVSNTAYQYVAMSNKEQLSNMVWVLFYFLQQDNIRFRSWCLFHQMPRLIIFVLLVPLLYQLCYPCGLMLQWFSCTFSLAAL